MMSARNITLILTLAALLAVALPNPVVAQSADVVARLQSAVQQLTAARDKLKRENSSMEKDLKKLQKQVEAMEKENSSLQRRLGGTEERLALSQQYSERQSQQYTDLQDRAQEVVAKYRETAGMLREVETQSNGLQQALAVRDGELRDCVDTNLQMFDLNAEVLDSYDQKGVWAAIAQREPFTGLKRVQLENLIDEYRYRAEDLQIELPASLHKPQETAAKSGMETTVETGGL